MCQGFRDLGLGQSVVHPDVDVTGKLRGLPGRDQRADRDEAAVTRRKAGPQPKIAEKNIGRVLRDARKYRAEKVSDALGAIRFGGFVERQKFRRCGRKLVGRDLVRGEYILGDRDRRHGIAPARVERKMRDNLGDFGRLNAVIEREVEILRHLSGLIARDQRRERDDATIAKVEAGPLPQVAEQGILLVLFERGRDRAHVFARFGGSACAADDASSDSDASVMAISFMMISYPFCRLCADLRDETGSNVAATPAAPSTTIALTRNTEPKPFHPASMPSAGLPKPSATSRKTV